MKILHCLALLCLFHNVVIAQHSFDPGYIINQNRDTVRGFVETTEEKNLSGTVHFKKESNGELKEYFPKDLFGFGINQEPYRSIQFSNTIEGNLMETVFARQLVSGDYNLFTFVTSARFFLLQKDTVFSCSMMNPRMVPVMLTGLEIFKTISTLSAFPAINLKTNINR